MIRTEIDSLIDHAKQTAERKGETIKPDEELKKEYGSTAKENIKSVILLEAIGKKENIEATENDTKSAIEEIAARNNLKPEEVTQTNKQRDNCRTTGIKCTGHKVWRECCHVPARHNRHRKVRRYD